MKIYGGEGGIAFEGKRCNWAATGGETAAPGAELSARHQKVFSDALLYRTGSATYFLPLIEGELVTIWELSPGFRGQMISDYHNAIRNFNATQ